MAKVAWSMSTIAQQIRGNDAWAELTVRRDVLSRKARCGTIYLMIKALEQAVEKVKRLSKEQQEHAAEALEQIVAVGGGVYALTDEERRRVREGLDELDRNDIATETQVREVFDKYRV
jgi:hypothetical protein